jgi:hypothetical protein
MKKIALIVSINPTWADMSEKLYPEMKEEVRRFKESVVVAIRMHRSFGAMTRPQDEMVVGV